MRISTLQDSISQDQLDEMLILHELWLKEDSCGVKADLSGKDLSGLVIQNKILDKINLSGSTLYDVQLQDTSLKDANLDRVRMAGVNLADVDLSHATCCRVHIEDSVFHDTILYSTDFNDSCIENCYFENVYFCFAKLSHTYLYKSTLNKVDFSSGDLSHIIIDNCNLSADCAFGATCLACSTITKQHIYQISCIGSSNRTTTFWADNDIVWCGCFKGTFQEWRDKIYRRYDRASDRYRKQYTAALKYFAELAYIDNMPQFKKLLKKRNNENI